ncbi:MAG: hypothetical protein IJ121_00185 [Eubacterium sp.]|nr:hypothetical protein [Eubacterium sp.]
MFGYITIDRDELKVRDYETYNHFYCGLCQDLKRTSGQRSRPTLTYDMTFLAILLTALYEEEITREVHRCMFHGGARRMCYRNRYTSYAADMNMLLVYHNLMDDWIDEKNRTSLAAARLLKKSYSRTAERYPEKVQAIKTYLKELHRAEHAKSTDLDLAAGLTGTLMREIFTFQADHWSRSLGDVGFYLGKYIYLKDAFDDLEEDRKNGTYNPFFAMADEPDFQKRANEILTMMASSAARAFERLPIVEYADLLRNVLYSGLWVENPKLSGKEWLSERARRGLFGKRGEKKQNAGSI